MHFVGTKILKTSTDQSNLHKMLSESYQGKMKYELLWQGTRDGFRASDFHSKCNGKGPTVTVIVSSYDKIFGGYTSVTWQSSNSWSHDPSAFIYSLTHNAKCATQLNTGRSIYDYGGLGPIFGYRSSGDDIYIQDNCNGRSDNCCASNNTYQLPPGADTTTFMAGAVNFSVKEIEVYQVIKS